MVTSPATALTLFGLGLAILLGAAATARFRHAADRGLWLAALMVALAAQMLANVALASGAILRWPHLAQVHVPFAFAIGPLLYLHVRARSGGQGPGRAWRHLLVALIALVMLLPFYVSDAETKRTFMAVALEQYPVAWRIRQALLLTHMGVYVFVSWRGSRPIETVSETFVWSRGLAAACAAAWVVAALRFVVAYHATTAPFATATTTLGLAAVILGGLATTTAARSRTRATVPPASDEETDCLQTVLRRLRDEQLFRRRDLTLETLASAVGTTPHFLSKVVNERCATTVPELVNRFRVQAAQGMLSHQVSGARPIHEIAEAVGFTSRSAFNAAFKRHVGTTPSAFRDRSCADS
jgi:AraC-like DNA-binding protein